MIKVYRNPIDIAFKAFIDVFGANYNCVVHFIGCVEQCATNNKLGRTIEFKKANEPKIIEISLTDKDSKPIDINLLVDIIIHELTHLAVGYKEKHSSYFWARYQEIKDRYAYLMQKQAF